MADRVPGLRATLLLWANVHDGPPTTIGVMPDPAREGGFCLRLGDGPWARFAKGEGGQRVMAWLDMQAGDRGKGADGG